MLICLKTTWNHTLSTLNMLGACLGLSLKLGFSKTYLRLERKLSRKHLVEQCKAFLLSSSSPSSFFLLSSSCSSCSCKTLTNSLYFVCWPWGSMENRRPKSSFFSLLLTSIINAQLMQVFSYITIHVLANHILSSTHQKPKQLFLLFSWTWPRFPQGGAHLVGF